MTTTKRCQRWAAAATAVMLLPLALGAHDVYPPDWRSDPNTTFLELRFDTNANPATPEAFDNDYGTPSASIVVGAFGSGWLHQLPGLGTQTGYWDLGSAGTITLSIPNVTENLPLQELWLQVTYFQDISQPPTVEVQGGLYLGGEMSIVENVPTGGRWWVELSKWQIQPSTNPNIVTITSSADWGSVIDQVVVDTQAMIPEPATALLLAMGFASFMAGRGRRGARRI